MLPLFSILMIGMTFVLSSCGDGSSSSVQSQPKENISFEVEGPYQVKVLDQQLFYANTYAQRFQVIDIAQSTHPYLKEQRSLFGYPKEFYVRGSQYLLLQSDGLQEDSRLTVLNQEQNGRLTTLHDFSLPGHVMVAQQRGSWFYVVTRLTDITSNESYKINVLKWNNQGYIEEVKSLSLSDPVTLAVFFPDDALLTLGETSSEMTKLQIFSLSHADDPLVELPSLQIEGNVPSKSHLDVFHQQLRVVYDSVHEGNQSIVAVYDLASPNLALIGKANLVLPESVSSPYVDQLPFARFMEQRAWVVGQNGKLLWGIDFSQPFSPQVTNPLEVGGLIRDLAFHDHSLLLLLSRDLDQHTKLELNLMDTTLFHQPIVISQFTPATPYSDLINDFFEIRGGLSVHWPENFAWFSFESEGTSFIQRVSFANRSIEEAGRFDSPFFMQRLFQMTSEDFLILGDQTLLTLHWPVVPTTTPPQKLSSLELATNLTRIRQNKEELWVGEDEPAQIYRYTNSDLEMPNQSWNLSRNYSGFDIDQHWIIFYTRGPTLTVQLLDTLTGQLYPPQVLLEQADRVIGPFVYQGGFYYAESLPPPGEQENLWRLHRWDIASLQETSSWEIPNQIERFFIINGKLIIQEKNASTLRFHQWDLGFPLAHLVSTHEFPCLSYSPIFVLEDESMYINCLKEYKVRYWGPWGAVYDENQELVTQILKLNPGNLFSEEGRWIFPGVSGVQAVAPNTVLITPELLEYRYRDTYKHCEVHRIFPGQEPFLLKKLEICTRGESTLLTPDQVWMAQGLAGLREVHW